MALNLGAPLNVPAGKLTANNLNGFFKGSPNEFLSKAIRVSITQKQYVSIYGYFDCMCDNF